MKVGIFSPAIPPSITGNARSVERIAEVLNGLGVEVFVRKLDDLTPNVLSQLHREVDLVHGFHLQHSYVKLRGLELPYVLSQTGTDLNSHLLQDSAYRRFIDRARKIIVPHQLGKEEVSQHLPDTANRICVVPKSVFLPEQGEELDRELEERLAEKLIVLLPAHIRPVKGIRTAIAGFADFLRLVPRELGKKCVLVIAGGIIDRPYYDSLKLEQYQQVLHVELRPGQMRAIFERSHLVLNCSYVEGLSNALLEALFVGRPVLARKIDGNCALASLAAAAGQNCIDLDGAVGFFSETGGPESLAAKMAELFTDCAQLSRLSAVCRASFAWLGDRQREGLAYKSIYEAVLAQ